MSEPRTSERRKSMELVRDERGTWGLPATHRYYAPGVWLPKESSVVCPETFGQWACVCAKGHELPHRNAHGDVIGPPTNTHGLSRKEHVVCKLESGETLTAEERAWAVELLSDKEREALHA